MCGWLVRNISNSQLCSFAENEGDVAATGDLGRASLDWWYGVTFWLEGRTFAEDSFVLLLHLQYEHVEAISRPMECGWCCGILPGGHL